MDPAITIALVAGVPSVVAAAFAYRSSARANKISETKVDAEAYDRSQLFYEKLLAEAEKHLERLRSQVERLNDQLDRVNNQLAQEQDTSNALRNHVRTLQLQVNSLEATVNELRIQLNGRGGTPTAGPVPV